MWPSLSGASDFLGVNYYTRWQVGALDREPLTANPVRRRAISGWEIFPEGLEIVLRATSQCGPPLLVTENGIADAKDRWRPEFIRASLEALDRARDSGVDVRGYLHWTLFDNFEWADGHAGRFGLYRTDFETPALRASRGPARVCTHPKSRAAPTPPALASPRS